VSAAVHPSPNQYAATADGDARSIEEHESDVEAAVGIDCPSAARHQRKSMLDGRGADKQKYRLGSKAPSG
jgi:hypothetical protein